MPFFISYRKFKFGDKEAKPIGHFLGYEISRSYSHARNLTAGQVIKHLITLSCKSVYLQFGSWTQWPEWVPSNSGFLWFIIVSEITTVFKSIEETSSFAKDLSFYRCVELDKSIFSYFSFKRRVELQGEEIIKKNPNKKKTNTFHLVFAVNKYQKIRSWGKKNTGTWFFQLDCLWKYSVIL